MFKVKKERFNKLLYIYVLKFYKYVTICRLPAKLSCQIVAALSFISQNYLVLWVTSTSCYFFVSKMVMMKLNLESKYLVCRRTEKEAVCVETAA